MSLFGLEHRRGRALARPGPHHVVTTPAVAAQLRERLPDQPLVEVARNTDLAGEGWYYWLDSFGIGYFGVRFGPDGRVTGTHGN